MPAKTDRAFVDARGLVERPRGVNFLEGSLRSGVAGKADLLLAQNPFIVRRHIYLF